jgi:hypothetical protein
MSKKNKVYIEYITWYKTTFEGDIKLSNSISLHFIGKTIFDGEELNINEVEFTVNDTALNIDKIFSKYNKHYIYETIIDKLYNNYKVEIYELWKNEQEDSYIEFKEDESKN